MLNCHFVRQCGAHSKIWKRTPKNLKQILHLLCIFSICRPKQNKENECMNSCDCPKREYCAEIDGKNKCVKLVEPRYIHCGKKPEGEGSLSRRVPYDWDCRKYKGCKSDEKCVPSKPRCKNEYFDKNPQ